MSKVFRGLSGLQEAIKEFGADIKLKLIKPAGLGGGIEIHAPAIPEGTYKIDIPINAQGGASERPYVDGDTPAAFNNNTYQEIWRYTVGNDVLYSLLHEISIDCDRFDIAEWRITIAGNQIYEGRQFQSAFTMLFKGLDGKGLKLTPAQEVLIEAVSDGATNITCTGEVTATEALSTEAL